ncbi:hypothetical protein X975_18730, partial [Stegodyphus mimosarum]
MKSMLPDLMVDVPAATRRNLWFQHDEAASHFSSTMWEYLNRTYLDRLIDK